MVKRIALVLALVGALAPAGVAWAAPQPFVGTFDDPGQRRASLSFDLATKKSGERLVKHWEWDDLKIRCRNGRHRYDGKFKKLSIPVIEGDFSKVAENSWGGKAVLIGHIDPKATASGTFKIKGNTSVGKHCKSGVLHWMATGFEPAAK